MPVLRRASLRGVRMVLVVVALVSVVDVRVVFVIVALVSVVGGFRHRKLNIVIRLVAEGYYISETAKRILPAAALRPARL